MTTNYEKLEDYLVYDLRQRIDYCRCGHSSLRHISKSLSSLRNNNKSLEMFFFTDDLTKEVKFHCEQCDCVNFR